MKRSFVRACALITTSLMMMASRIEAFAATAGTQGMGKFFEKVYDFIFKKSLDSLFEKQRDEVQLRIKTGIVVVLFVLIFSAALITCFVIMKSRIEQPEPEELCEGEEDIQQFDCEEDELE